MIDYEKQRLGVEIMARRGLDFTGTHHSKMVIKEEAMCDNEHEHQPRNVIVGCRMSGVEEMVTSSELKAHRDYIG